MYLPAQAVAHEALSRIIARTTFPSDEDEDGCWETDFTPAARHPMMWVCGRNQMVHRLAHLVINQDDPLTARKPQVNHDCGNSRCWRPDHLKAGNPTRNTKDAMRHGTFISNLPIAPGGADNHNAKLTWEDVRAIRERYVPHVMTMPMLAREYGVVAATIANIIYQRSYWPDPTQEVA